ncbi:hypothetical protein CF327_g5465 [Tilletia walkeri]|uniref:Uncharacterized protein n=1 Tax=Tilletia walkeri TaxID=117179 RepID=A0A8X7N822_9BASI|nr:hypothetical protein CF327_g5465 [Tilletia walkeri]KAE8268028.1 hypothetical protein A4X09_0g4331 [Tilletia walkeri]
MSQLERTGGAGDRGVDLTGWWYPPPPPPPPSTSRSTGNRARVRVLVQCKYQASAPLGPVHMRELEGTMYRKGFEARMLGKEDDDNRDSQEIQKDEGKIYRVPLLGILTSSTGFSSACARYSLASPFPLLLLHIPFSSIQQQQNAATITAQGATPSFTVLPNRAFVASAGLMEGRLEFRSTRRISTGSEDGADENADDEEDTDDMDSDKLALNSIDSPEILLDGRPLREHLSST